MTTWSGYIALGTVTGGAFTESTATGYARQGFSFGLAQQGRIQGFGQSIRFTATSAIITYNSYAFYTALTGSNPILVYALNTPFAFGFHAERNVNPYNVILDMIDQMTGEGLPLDIVGAGIIAGFGSPSGNPQIEGSLLIGTGTLAQGVGIPYQFQSAINFDPATVSSPPTSVWRQSMFNTTLNYTSADTTNIWEGLTSFVTASGPHAAQGEINCIHGYLQINTGLTATAGECFEASMLNNGTITNWSGVLSIANNGTAGVSSSMAGFNTGLTNNNTTAGALNTWEGFHMAAMLGAGAAPTNYFCFRNDEPLASFMTLGGVVIGQTGQQTGPGTLFLKAADNSGGTFAITVKNQSGANLFLLNNAGDLTVVDGTAAGNWAANRFTVNSTCTITSGSGAPSGTQPNGSLYMRTDGAANTRIYVSEGSGTWTAIASA